MVKEDESSSSGSSVSSVDDISTQNSSAGTAFFQSQTRLVPYSIPKPPLAVCAEPPAPKKKNMFMLEESFSEDKSSLEEPMQHTQTIDKQTEVFIEYESAIEDDDLSDWEDLVDDSGHSSIKDKHLFQRVNSRPKLTSCSLITTLFHEPKYAATLANAASPALSPRTTRRNMLTTELTESLRRDLLWELRPR